jgi:hypothetical protein
MQIYLIFHLRLYNLLNILIIRTGISIEDLLNPKIESKFYIKIKVL